MLSLIGDLRHLDPSHWRNAGVFQVDDPDAATIAAVRDRWLAERGVLHEDLQRLQFWLAGRALGDLSAQEQVAFRLILGDMEWAIDPAAVEPATLQRGYRVSSEVARDLRLDSVLALARSGDPRLDTAALLESRRPLEIKALDAVAIRELKDAIIAGLAPHRERMSAIVASWRSGIAAELAPVDLPQEARMGAAATLEQALTALDERAKSIQALQATGGMVVGEDIETALGELGRAWFAARAAEIAMPPILIIGESEPGFPRRSTYTPFDRHDRPKQVGACRRWPK